MSTTASAPAVCYTVRAVVIIRGTPHEHIAARNLTYHDAAALVADYRAHGQDAQLIPQPPTPFTAWQA